MKRILKWIGIVLGSLVGVLIVACLVLYVMGNIRINKVYKFPASNIVLPTDPASLEYGKHRVESLCAGCHGADLSGQEKWFNGGPLGTIDTANLTAGEGGIGQEYTSTEDYVLAIRHGVDPEGKPIYMPAVVSTAHLSDKDLGAVIAYLKTVPPVNHKTNGKQFTPLANILFAAGVFGKLPVEAVSHATQVSAPQAGASVEYGEYLVNINDCHICHGPTLAGAKNPDPTIKNISPNLTPGGEVGLWSEKQFIETIRTGVTPGGHALDPELMPWKYYRMFYNDELKAIYMYLHSLPKLPQYTP